MKPIGLVAVAAIIVAGCAGAGGNRNTTPAVAYRMYLADSLEQVMAIRQAADQYAIIAREHPRSSAYPRAVRKAAMLYASEYNTARSDSLSLYWFTAYLALPLKKSERDEVQTYVTLLQRIKTIRDELNRRVIVADSLIAVTKKQAGTMTADMRRRIAELEASVNEAQTELRKMKDIDLRLSKSRSRK
jgi:hypothetical protein